ncbi:dTDP-4-dehydrorhamnose reductase [Methylobacterium tarhaniae]|uniref:dTDP-4-dehydrorhamnose reductase n=1 Tax=Methylobacterium tarhaniae TaxID=1187852 RepID=A0A0J6VXX0_9HYPH|nr:sugar nucleotide-binding protein [Methylobacterium tarhaniae]KMO44161.1 dTDP-4-dehydrorhamnose reductase [Methylobacterium tarhaniae]
MLELWGGIECSIVRVGDAWRDQVAETGHRDRPDDLDRVASLGLTTLRYPVLWESVAPEDPDICDWTWHDDRLARLRRLGLAPVIGLVHHGSGPLYTNLLDPSFPHGLARHAGRVAARYPWITAFTPVNEPLTTARFAGLYGHWYPHARSKDAFLRMVVNQCRATLLAMRAIRAVTPAARLIQTEDIGKTFSTPALAGQAAYENERRWLSLDLLCGRVDPAHSWHARLHAAGVSPSDLDDFLGGEACPDVIGVNHYLTSERYLDEARGTYPSHLHGGNGRFLYADAEAVRIRHLAGLTGPRARLTEVWERYRRPLAVTEVHHGCTRDDQLRWLAAVWDAARDTHEAGVPVQAVTLWSLFGAMDWNSLLLRRNGHYEPGAFDIRSPEPRLTALGRAAQDLARTGRMHHPVLAAPGWWGRADRFYTQERDATENSLPPAPPPTDASPGPCIAILAGVGPYGAVIGRICTARGLASRLVDEKALAALLGEERAWAVIDATSLATAASAKRYPGGTFRADVRAGGRIAGLCARAGLPLLAFSSDLVFDGRLGRSAVESDPLQPSCSYGMSEAEREAGILSAHPRALIARTSLVFGLEDGSDEAERILADLAEGFSRSFPRGEIVSPTYLPDLVHAALDLLIDGESGSWHLVNEGETSRASFAARLARVAGLPPPAPPGPRDGRNTALASARGKLMPPLDDAVVRFVAACRPRVPGRLAAE